MSKTYVVFWVSYVRDPIHKTRFYYICVSHVVFMFNICSKILFNKTRYDHIYIYICMKHIWNISWHIVCIYSYICLTYICKFKTHMQTYAKQNVTYAQYMWNICYGICTLYANICKLCADICANKWYIYIYVNYVIQQDLICLK